jgi:DNA-binding NarL/FixJ family response regulator
LLQHPADAAKHAIDGRRAVKTARILIADDHELVRQGMRAIFQSEPHWVVCGEATTGRQALAMTLELKPDLVVLDVALPEMNGIEVTRQIRRALPAAVLIVTMHDSDQIVQEAMEAGANGFVLKAEAGRALADAVHAILSHGEFISERVGRVAGRSVSDGEIRPGRSKPLLLTSREREVLQLLAEGQANKEVANALGITTKTAETHRARIMSKLEVHSMSELVRYAIRNHIIDP